MILQRDSTTKVKLVSAISSRFSLNKPGFVAELWSLPVLPVLPPSAAEEKEAAGAPRAPSGGLAALLHHPLFRHFG